MCQSSDCPQRFHGVVAPHDAEIAERIVGLTQAVRLACDPAPPRCRAPGSLFLLRYFLQKLLDGEHCNTLRAVLAGRAESEQLLQGRCQQIGQLLLQAAANPAELVGCVMMH